MLGAVGLGFAGSAATMNCENAVCVVTGASSGLGNAVATELLRRGARVAALDLVECHMARVQFPQRPGEAAEFAELACHIIENKYLNAETIRLDGGLRL
jgi:nucleoside-diphosphate-sugar epimerase